MILPHDANPKPDGIFGKDNRVDIGIVHPDKKGNYVLGVECDGAIYLCVP